MASTYGEIQDNLEAQEVDVSIGFFQKPEEIRTVTGDWSSQLERCHNKPVFFQSPSFCSIFFNKSSFRGTEQPDACCIIIRKSDQIVLVLPLIVHRRMGLKIAFWLGSPITQNGTIALTPGTDGITDILRLLTERVKQELKIDLIQLRRTYLEQKMVDEFMSFGSFLTELDRSYFINLSTYESFLDYEQILSARTRKSRRRARNKLEKLHQIEFEVHTSRDIAQFASQVITMKRKTLNDKGDTSRAFLKEDTFNDLIQLSSLEGNPAGVTISVLKIDGKTAAMELGFVNLGRYYAYIGAMEPEFHHLRIGSYQIEKTIEWAIENNVEIFDFLPPASPYKSSWAKQNYYDVADWNIPLSLKGKIFGSVIFKYGLPFVRQTFDSSPRCLKTMMQSVAQRFC